MTPAYSVGDRVSIEWRRKTWVDGEVIQEAMNNGTVCVLTVHGKRWVYPGVLRPVTERRSLKLAVPEVSEEAESYESARERSTVRAELRAVPKAKTPRSRSHLDFVRSLPCAWCGAKGKTEASHHGTHGTGIKASDLRAIPLCVECHRMHHTGEGLPKSSMTHDQTREWFKDRALDVHEALAAERRNP